eukprot:Amastigsp_a847130_153.p4 type:complete len:102 gc:universal Amastigsp_a847130_153:568-263(-)
MVESQSLPPHPGTTQWRPVKWSRLRTMRRQAKSRTYCWPQSMQYSTIEFPWSSQIMVALSMPDLTWRPSQFWEMSCFMVPSLASWTRAMCERVGYALMGEV